MKIVSLSGTAEQGVTVIEILMVAAIFTLICGIVFTTLRLNETFRDLIFVKIQLYRQNRRAHEFIIEELQKAANVTIPNPNEIRFSIPLVNSMDPITYDIPWGAPPNYVGGYIRYWLNNTSAHLMREVLDSGNATVSGTQEIKASNIIDLQFSWAGAYNIAINTTTRKMTIPPQHPVNDTLESSVTLAN